jgi:sortase A
MKNKRIQICILVLGFLIGLSLLLYPSISNWWNAIHATDAISSYLEATENMDTIKRQEMLEAAQNYNKELMDCVDRFVLTDEQEEEYESLLRVGDDNIMGYINIPSISVYLPIYHGVEEASLQVGAGHIPGSSLPVGGLGTHCVISGHRGLPSATLFSDLNQLQEGDIFILYTLDLTLTYEVDQIRIVLPDETDDLEIDSNEDYCTLVTCTPYGVNSHRLLVRGHRIDNISGDAQVTSDALQIDPIIVAPAVGLPILAVILTVLLKGDNSRKRKQREKDKEILKNMLRGGSS